MMSKTKKIAGIAATAMLACMLTAGVGLVSARAEAPTDASAWDAPPATWSFTDEGAVNNNAGFLGNYLVRTDENAIGDYTVSTTFRGTGYVSGEVNIGLIPWYLDAQNYVIIYLQWRDFGANLGNFQVLYFKDGIQHGAEGATGWNDNWHDSASPTYTDTLYTLTPADTITVSVDKRYDAIRGLDAYNITIGGTNAQQQAVSETFTTDAYSISVPYAAQTAKVGLYSMSNTVTLTDFSVTPAQNSTNYVPVEGSDAVARTTSAGGWTYADGAYTVDASASASAAETQAIIPNPNADNNYNVSYTAAFTGGDGNVCSILPYYADESNYARYLITQTADGAQIAIEGKAAGASFGQSFEAYTGAIDWSNVTVRASKSGTKVSLYLGEELVATYETPFTGGARVGFGAKGSVTFTSVGTQSEAYVPYDWYTKGGYTISDRDMASVEIDGASVTMTVDAQETDHETRFYAPAGNFYNRISVSGTVTVTENEESAGYGFYLYYADDANNVRVRITAEKIVLVATEKGTAAEYESAFAEPVDLTQAHTLAAQAEFSSVTVTFDNAAVVFESGETVQISMLAALDSANVGMFAIGGSIAVSDYTVSGFVPYSPVTKVDWSLYGARLNTWTVSEDGATLSNTLAGGTNFRGTNAMQASELADPAKGYYVSAAVQVTEQTGGEWKYGIVPYYKDDANNVFVWLSQWSGAATTICMYATFNGVPAFSSSPNGFLETQVNFTMTEINDLEVEITPDGSINVYLNRSLTPTATTQINAMASAGAGSYGVNAFNVAATFSDVQISPERVYSVENEVIINIPASFPTTGTVGKPVNLGVITASLEGDGGIAPTPVITVTGPDDEEVELSGVRFTPEKEGTYTVTITATDSWGNSATETREIVISAASSSQGGSGENGGEGESEGGQPLTGGAIAGIVVAAVVVAAGIGVGVFFLVKKKRK